MHRKGYPRVCFATTIFPPYPEHARTISVGGAVIDLTSFAKVLQDRGFDVSVIALDFSFQKKQRDPSNVFRVGVYSPYLAEESSLRNALNFMAREFMDFPLLVAFLRRARRIKPDVIIIGQTYGFGFVPFVGARILRVPYMIRYDWLCPSYPEDIPCNFSRRTKTCGKCMQQKNNVALSPFSKSVFSILTALNFLVRVNLWKRAKNILVFNSFYREHYSLYGIPTEKFVVVTPDRKLPIPARSETNERNGFFKIAFVGRLTKEKGVQLLVDSFRLIMSTSDRIYLTIAGDGPLRPVVECLVNQYPRNLSYLGWIEGERLSEVYLNSDAVIIPSIVPEANPIVAREAIQFQNMVVGFGRGGLKDILRTYSKGVILEDISSQSLSRKILEIAESAGYYS